MLGAALEAVGIKVPFHKKRCVRSASAPVLDSGSSGVHPCVLGADGHIVLWSHVTGFKLATFTLHSTAIKSLAFNHGTFTKSTCLLMLYR